jgi:hypothetical protein
MVRRKRCSARCPRCKKRCLSKKRHKLVEAQYGYPHACRCGALWRVRSFVM